MGAVIFRAVDDRHLIYIRGEQALEQGEERLFWRGPQDFVARNHDGLYGGVGPLVAWHRIEQVDIHHADQAIVGGHQVAAATGAQGFLPVVFERNISRDGRHFVAHDVGGAKAVQGFANGNLGDAFLRRIQQEPPDESKPQTGLPLTPA